ncbi:MAG: hypothetical protein LUG56_10165 [Lachnospiraceae bacterium]|nr:hypothetical protein [Lachnospiraceae bacterium]
MFVIITDGAENASREYSLQRVRNQIESQKEKYGWEFIFLGANMDAVTTARSFGINENRVADYVADSEGTELNFRMMSEAVADYRVSGAVHEVYLEPIRKNARKRKATSEKS